MCVNTPWTQVEHLNTNDTGICNALVLEWLSNGGRPFTTRVKNTVKRAKVTNNEGVNSVLFQECLLRRNGIYLAEWTTNHEAIKAIADLVEEVKNAPEKLYFLALSYGLQEPGHAIGMLKTGSTIRFFEPNEGFYQCNNTCAWVRLKYFITDAACRGGKQAFLYGLSPVSMQVGAQQVQSAAAATTGRVGRPRT